MKRVLKIVSGFLLLAAGVAMLALPGPGWAAILGALAILATEYVWARNLLERLKQSWRKMRTSLRERRDTPAR